MLNRFAALSLPTNVVPANIGNRQLASDRHRSFGSLQAMYVIRVINNASCKNAKLKWMYSLRSSTVAYKLDEPGFWSRVLYVAGGRRDT
jgi:hypothetical protein